MRITPLICVQCGSWFLPKTRRMQKTCTNACRQANYLGKECWGIEFTCPNEWAEEKLMQILQDADERIEASPSECLDALYKKDHQQYRDIIFRWGVDKFGMNGRQWLAKNPPNI